jgi:hypothetical protein
MVSITSGKNLAPTIVIGGSLAQRPFVGGHTWVFLQYILGFRRLGWNVLFIDRLEDEMCVDASGRPCTVDQSVNLQYVLDVMASFDLSDSFALFCDDGNRVIGLPRPEVLTQLREADFFLNVMGFITNEELLGAARRRVFLDIDPGFGQMWRALGLHDLFAGYDAFVTIGENIGQERCVIPTCGLTWITTPQPVLLDHWPIKQSPGLDCLTTIASWRGAFGPVQYLGHTYGLRVHEFRKFFDLPRQTGRSFRLALDIHQNDGADIQALRSHGWSLLRPEDVARDPVSYATFIGDSAAEFMVAKSMYVDTNSGWISDRTICYLASGKPAVTQDTGIQGRYPTGEGLLTFSTMDGAIASIQDLANRYTVHASAARALAEEYFDSDKVLTRLVEQVGTA